MAAKSSIEPILSRLYEAALEPRLWPAAWAEATAAGGAASPSLMLVATNPAPVPFATPGWSRHAVGQEPALPEGELTDIVPSGVMPTLSMRSVPAASAAPVARTRQIGTASAAVAAQPMECPVAFADPVPTPEQERTVQLHLQRAMQVRTRLATAQAMLAASTAALQAADIGVVLVTAGGRIVHADAVVRRLASGVGLQLDSGRGGLQALDPEATAHLHGLVHDAAAGGAGGDMLIRAANGSAIAVAVSALQSGDDPDLAVEEQPRHPSEAVGAHVMVVLRRLVQEVPCPKRVATLFGLTQSEADVAVAVTAGSSVAAVAARRGASPKVVQAQLRAALDKAGLSTERELAILFARLG